MAGNDVKRRCIYPLNLALFYLVYKYLTDTLLSNFRFSFQKSFRKKKMFGLKIH